MVSATTGNDENNSIQKILQWIADAGINGLGILPPAEQVAEEFLTSKNNSFIMLDW